MNCARLTKLLGLALLLALGACADDKLQATFIPDNPLPATIRWDNAISLQGLGGGESDIVEVVVHAGRASTSSDTDPNAPTLLLLPRITRFQATLLYNPAVLEFDSFEPGTFFEPASGGQTVTYNVVAESNAAGPTGRLSVNVSVPSSATDLRKGDFVKLVFLAIDDGFSALTFEGGFGNIERGGQAVTGSSYYGAKVNVLDPSTD